MIDKPNIFKYIWYLHFSSYNANIFLLTKLLQNKFSIDFWLLLQCLLLFTRIIQYSWDSGHQNMLVLPYIRYTVMSCVRKYAWVHFLSIVFASALAALLLSSWFIDILSCVLSEKHGEWMNDSNAHMASTAFTCIPAPNTRQGIKKLSSCLCHMIFWIFPYSRISSEVMKNYCQELGWYVHGILIKKDLFWTLPMCLQSYKRYFMFYSYSFFD